MKRLLCVFLLLASNAFAQVNGSLEFSNIGTYNGSYVSWAIDSKVKSYRVIPSPSPGYAVAAVVGETNFDLNANGGLGVGGYFSATLKGTPNPNSVNDAVGVHATVHKDAAGWAFGMHSDVYDTVPGGVSGGLNIEFPQTVQGNRYIGVNIQSNSTGSYEGVNFQGKVTTAINLQETADVTSFMRISSASTMWFGAGSPNGAQGTYVGKIKLLIDGQTYFMPIYK